MCLCIKTSHYKQELCDLSPLTSGTTVRRGNRQAGERAAAHTHLFLAVFQHVLVLGELFVLLGFDAFGLVPQPGGVLLLQPLDGLLLLPFQVLHFLVILTLLALWDTGGGGQSACDRGSKSER